MTYINFYALQALIFAYFHTKNKQLSLYLWAFTSFILMPVMLVINLWGNLIIEEMDNNPECEYNGYA
jgi:choline-glycine betaine transporter